MEDLKSHQSKRTSYSREIRPNMIKDRTAVEYASDLQGIAEFFKYVSELSTPTVLDIGAGTTQAIKELSKTPFIEGLGIHIEATVMPDDPANSEVSKNFGWDKTHKTSVEELEGIPDESVGGILAVHSISYSENPLQAADSINRVLIRGGVIKASFKTEDSRESQEHSPQQFVKALEQKGYDYGIVRDDKGVDVVLAIKPGGNVSISAEILLKEGSKRLVVKL